MDEHQYELPDDLLVGRRAVPLEALGERDSLRPKATPSRRADHELIRNEMVEAVAQWIERQKNTLADFIRLTGRRWRVIDC